MLENFVFVLPPPPDGENAVEKRQNPHSTRLIVLRIDSPILAALVISGIMRP